MVAAMKTIQLQGIGKREAIEAKNLMVGDVMLCNFGYKQTITSVEATKTGKSIKAVIECNGKIYNKTFRNDRLIAVERVSA